MNAIFNPTSLTKILLLILAVISARALLSAGKPAQLSKQYKDFKRTTDYTMHNFTMTVMSPLGQASRIIDGAEMAHYLDDDSTEIILPRVQFIKPQEKTWLVSSNKGFTQGKGEDVLLLGNVIINQKENPDIELRTEKLNLDSIHNTAYTDLAVSMKSPHGTTDSVGLHADLNDKMINLHSRVKGHFDAPPIQ